MTNGSHSPQTWRLIAPDGEATGAENMAVDQAMLESVMAGAPPALRFYRWRPACISLGRNQQAREVFDRDSIAAAGVDIVRRPTGGGAVLHDRELTYAVAVPAVALGGPRQTYARVNAALAAGLRVLGIHAEVASPRDRSGLRDASRGVCFQAAAPGEILANGRKLVGSAQRREASVILQHGSLLLDGSQALLADVLGAGRPGWEGTRVMAGAAPAGPRSGASVAAAAAEITVASLLGRVPAWSDLVAALRTGFETILGVRLTPAGLSGAESTRAGELEIWFRSNDWTWRR